MAPDIPAAGGLQIANVLCELSKSACLLCRLALDRRYIFSDVLHPFVRSKFARLAITMIVDASQTGYLLPLRVRVEPYVRGQVVSAGANDAKRVPAISQLKKDVLRYISSLDPVLDPAAVYQNHLTEQVLKICGRLLRAGNFSPRPHGETTIICYQFFSLPVSENMSV